MKQLPCDVFIDLMPLVQDGASSPASKVALQDHLTECDSCRALYAALTPGVSSEGACDSTGSVDSVPGACRTDGTLADNTALEAGAARTLGALRRLLLRGLLLVAALGALTGVALSESNGMFYDVLVFPLVGICAFFALRRRALLAPAGLFGLTYLWLLVKYTLEAGFDYYGDGLLALLTAPLVWAFLYTAFCAFGVLLGALYAFAFTRGAAGGTARPAAGRSRLTLRIASGVAALALSALSLLLANSLVGNPASRALARRNAEAYLAKSYPGQALVIDSAAYNFKFGDYVVHVRSTTSIDTVFTLDYDSYGRLTYDSYESSVASGWNTLMRLDTAYRDACDGAFAAYPYSFDISFGELVSDSDPDALGWLVRDDVYDVAALGAQCGRLCVYVQSDTVTPEAAAEALADLRRCFDAAGIGFAEVDFTLESTDRSAKSLNLLGFAYADIPADRAEDAKNDAAFLARVQSCIDGTAAYYAAMDAEKDAQEQL